MKCYPRHQLDIGYRDFAAGLLAYGQSLSRSDLHDEIASHWQERSIRVSFSVRTALDSLLTALKLPPGSEVLMSAINIKDMVSIVEHHGLKVVPVDIDIETMSISSETLQEAISDNSRVLILAQLLGSLAPLEEIARICQKHHILLLEDCAQAYCGPDYTGSEWADISLFSFGPIKSMTALGGAVVTFRSDELMAQVDSVEQAYPVRGEGWFARRILKYLCFKLLLQPYCYGALMQLLNVFGRDRESTINGFSRSFRQGDLIQAIRYQPPLHLLSLLAYRLRHARSQTYQQRRKQAIGFAKRLPDWLVVPACQADNHSYWVFPVLSDHAEALQLSLYEAGFDATCGSHAQTAIGGAPNAARFMVSALYLPSLSSLSDKASQTLLTVLTSASPLLDETNNE